MRCDSPHPFRQAPCAAGIRKAIESPPIRAPRACGKAGASVHGHEVGDGSRALADAGDRLDDAVLHRHLRREDRISVPPRRCEEDSGGAARAVRHGDEAVLRLCAELLLEHRVRPQLDVARPVDGETAEVAGEQPPRVA